MRRIVHGEVYFSEENKEIVLDLMRSQCSAMRSAYQAIHKHGLSGNEVRKYVKRKYMSALNQRYISDACSIASGINQEKSIFGGRAAWKNLRSGTLSKENWQQIRNSQLYSRGDVTKKGNPNIRVYENTLSINIPTERGKWIEGKLFIPEKWRGLQRSCYDIRIKYSEGRFNVFIGYDVDAPTIITSSVNGAVGLDINPDGVAVVETNEHGNPLKHFYLREQRIQFASTNKRDNDIRLLAKETVDYALSIGKPLCIEKLNFKNKKSKNKKFNRMRHNFVYRAIIGAVISRAFRCGVEVIEVNPAFTSILGKLKYEKMYSLSRHTAASLVIARRGVGIKERLSSLRVSESSSGKGIRFNLEGRDRSAVLTQKAFTYLAALTAPRLVPPYRNSGELVLKSKESGIRHGDGETPSGKSRLTTGRAGHTSVKFDRSMLQDDERRPLILGDKLAQVS